MHPQRRPRQPPAKRLSSTHKLPLRVQTDSLIFVTPSSMIAVNRNSPLTPTQAVLISVTAIILGAAGLAFAPRFLLVPFIESLIWITIGESLLLAFTWASLELDTYNRAIRAHNQFVYVVFFLIVIVMVIQWNANGQPFPLWGMIIGLISAVCCYGKMAYHGMMNFLKWMQGAYAEQNEDAA